MSFTSPLFLIFFFVVCTLNYFLPKGNRKYLLLAASFVFIGTFNLFSLGFVIFFTSFNFISAKYLSNKNKRMFYFVVIIDSLAIVLFNYLLASQGSLGFSFAPVDFKISAYLMVIGLSFYNLQHIAYIIDVYKKRIQAENNYLNFLLISTYFPKFISGPLTLYQELNKQIEAPAPNKSLLIQGFNRMLLGFFKKMVIADRLAPSVSSVFDYNDQIPGLTVLSAAILFTIQLYFDFSGYCDIAIGVSKMLGIELPENFDFPLRSSSITVFWRKWHKSLIHFFTNYIFYPVNFKYRKLKKHAAAFGIILTFFISAIWHGIGLTFLIWACCHMCYLLIELYFVGRWEKKTSKQKNIFSAGLVLLLVSFSNIFFRSTTFVNCRHLLSELFSLNFLPQNWAVDFIAPLSVGGHQAEHFNFIVTIIFIVFTLLFERKIFSIFSSTNFKTLLTLLMILMIFVFGVFNNGQRFIYMQF